VPALMVSLLSLFVTSLMTARPDQSQLRPFEDEDVSIKA
jgi:hypothetical protein